MFLSFQEWFVQLISIFSELAIGIAAIVGIWGIREWRRELIGKARFEVARKMMGLVYKFRHQFADARRPVFPGYAPGRVRREDETPEQKALLDEEHERKLALPPLYETLDKLREESWQAEIIFKDKSIREHIVPFEEKFKELHYAITSYYYKKLGGEGRDTTKEERAIHSGEDDELSKSIDAAVDNLSRHLEKHLQ